MNKIKEFQPNLTEDEKRLKKRFLIYRSNPEDSDDEPHLMSYYVDMTGVKPMYLDALIKIKDEMDSTLSFRRSCREGVCGSCAMNLDGLHKLACIQSYDPDPSKVSLITPLGHMFIVKDLVVDMSNFYAQYRSIQPYLQRSTPKSPGQRENLQTIEDRQLLDGLYECVLCASCSTSCPSYWWSPDEYLGPAVLMQAYRWIVDSRDQATEERLRFLAEGNKLNACENIGMCSFTCPKNLDPQKAIQTLFKMVQERQYK